MYRGHDPGISDYRMFAQTISISVNVSPCQRRLCSYHIMELYMSIHSPQINNDFFLILISKCLMTVCATYTANWKSSWNNSGMDKSLILKEWGYILFGKGGCLPESLKPNMWSIGASWPVSISHHLSSCIFCSFSPQLQTTISINTF